MHRKVTLNIRGPRLVILQRGILYTVYNLSHKPDSQVSLVSIQPIGSLIGPFMG